MEFQLHRDFSEIAAESWNALLAESVSDVPFLRYEYLSTWWQTRGGGEWPQAELLLISAWQDGRLIGIAPLFLAPHQGQPKVLLLGSIEISDYLDLIVRPGDLQPFLRGLLDFLGQGGAKSCQGLDWYNIPDASPTLVALKEECARRGWGYEVEVFRPTPYIPLPGSFEAYLASIDKKQRHEISRKMRRAEESGLGVRWYLVRQEETLDAEIDTFLHLMEEDQKKAEFLTAVMRQQMRDAVHVAFRNGWLWLAFLEMDGEKVAGMLNFDYRGRLWGYNSGVNQRFRELSPGWVLLAYVLQWAAENGRSEFDFMRVDEEYKYRFGARNRYVMRARVEWA